MKTHSKYNRYKQLCRCGSGRYPYPLRDVAGIFVDYVCEKCQAEKRRQFAPAFNTRTQYALTGEEEDIYNVPGED